METKYLSFNEALVQLSGAIGLSINEQQMEKLVALFEEEELKVSVTTLRQQLSHFQPSLQFTSVQEKQFPLQIDAQDINFPLKTAIALFQECP